MASTMSSYGIAISGLNTARTGLNVTAHNVSNSGTAGYSRQQAIQRDSFSTTIGTTSLNTLQIGTGSDVTEIRQIRDRFLDQNYREEAGKAEYHGAKFETGMEIESIFGEMESAYSVHGVISDMWDSLNELSIHPDGIETRGTFISTCASFIKKINNVGERMIDYQANLNQQVKDTVKDINDKIATIDKMNQKIKMATASGDNANDYEDARNQAMDELSGLADTTYKYDREGSVTVLINGNEMLSNGFIQKMGLQYTQKDSQFVKPVLSNEKEILPYDTKDVKEIYPNLASSFIDNAAGDDRGKLKGLLVSRGDSIATYATDPTSVANYTIPSIQQKFDTLVHEIVKMVNDAFAPQDYDASKAPSGLDGSQFTEIFVRNTSSSTTGAVPRYNGSTYNEEDTNNYYSMYTIGNIQINPDLLTSAGYNKIALSHKSADGDLLKGDNSVVLGIMGNWKTDNLEQSGLQGLGGLSVDNFYRSVVTDIGVSTNESQGFLSSQAALLDKIQNDRQSASGVSLDEELTSMMKYQHAYNSSSKVLKIIDTMVDEIIHGLKR